jgi:large subunit ribosomal protein L21
LSEEPAEDLFVYAIIETGGKQYKVREGDTVEVELLGDDIGDAVELRDVLMVAGDGEVAVGSPTVAGAVVKATVLDEVKGDKVVVFKYKPSNRYRRKTGHRQRYNRLRIDEIVLPGAETDDGRDVTADQGESTAAAVTTPEAVVGEPEMGAAGAVEEVEVSGAAAAEADEEAEVEPEAAAETEAVDEQAVEAAAEAEAVVEQAVEVAAEAEAVDEQAVEAAAEAEAVDEQAVEAEADAEVEDEDE